MEEKRNEITEKLLTNIDSLKMKLRLSQVITVMLGVVAVVVFVAVVLPII